MKVQEMIERQRAKIEQERMASDEHNAAIERLRADVMNKEVRPLVIEFLVEQCGLDQDELEPALKLGCHDHEWRTGPDGAPPYPGNLDVTLEFPQMEPIYVYGFEVSRDEISLTVKWRLRGGRYAFTVQNDERSGYGLDMFPSALMRAQWLYKKEQAELARQAELEREETSRIAEAARQREDELQQRQEMVDFLSADPAAFYLLRAFADIVRQREAWSEHLESAEERVGEIEARFDRKMQQADEHARDLKRQADDERRLREDAEYEAEQAKKKLRQAQS